MQRPMAWFGTATEVSPRTARANIAPAIAKTTLVRFPDSVARSHGAPHLVELFSGVYGCPEPVGVGYGYCKVANRAALPHGCMLCTQYRRLCLRGWSAGLS